jgi:hypothetical protein
MVPPPGYDAVPMEVRVPLDVGDCVRAVKSIDYEDLYGSPKVVARNDKGTLVHVAPDHVVVKWNRQETLARAAAFPHQVRRQPWPKGNIASISAWSANNQPPSPKEYCMTVVEYHGFPPMIKPMKCVKGWQNQQFTTPLACRPGQIYWKKDPTLCVDAVHPELVQLRDCNGLESQMFALSETDDVNVDNAGNEGFLVGTGTTKDLCFKFVDQNGGATASTGTEPHALHFGECDVSTDTKFQFKDFDKDSD